MKKILIALSFFLPLAVSAAPLTNDQATSLIAVVQSSTTTPASAFVPLITTFSNITVNQATTLIEVVQASPNTPANAFVNMLIAFTVDPVIITPVVQNEPVLGSSPAPTPAPVVESPVVEQVVKELVALIPWQGGPTSSEPVEIHYKENGKEIAGVPVTISVSQGDFLIPGQWGRDPGAGTRTNTITRPTTEKGLRVAYSTTGVDWLRYRDDGAFYPGATITITANGITKTLEGRRIYKVNE